MARSWFVTSNNPHIHYDWCSLRGDGTDTDDDYRTACEAFVMEWRRGRNNRMRTPDRSGAVVAFERGEQGTLHLHGLLCSKSDMGKSTLIEKFPQTDFRETRGSVDDCLDYLHKRGRHADKAETSLMQEPYQWGDYLCGGVGGGGKTFERIDAMLDQGMTPNDIFALGTKYAYYGQAIQRRYNALMADKARSRDALRCVYHTGDSGSGKSFTYKLLEQQGRSVYYTADYDHPFDSYNGEDVLFLDELRSYSFETPQLLSIMESYRHEVPARYSNRLAVYSEVHLSSIFPPEKIVPPNEPLKQLLRRIDEVVYHATAYGRYVTVSVRGAEYQNVKQLERLAIERLAEVERETFPEAFQAVGM